MQINYNEILLPFDILESTLSIHYTLPHTESELILFIGDNKVYSLVSCDTDDFLGSDSREVIEITIKRSLTRRGIFDTESEKCEIHVARENIILCDCADIQNSTFSIRGNLVSLYGVWLYHDSAFFAK